MVGLSIASNWLTQLTGAIDREKRSPAGVEGMDGGVAPPNRTPWPILVRMFPSISAKKLLCCSLRRATFALSPKKTRNA